MQLGHNQIENCEAIVPDWEAFLHDIYRAHSDPIDPPSALYDPFVTLAEPLISIVRKKLAQHLESIANKASGPAIEQVQLLISMEQHLAQRVFRASAKSLVVEMGIGQNSDCLEGATKEERYNFFASCLADPEVSGIILKHYPALAGALMQVVEDWLVFFADFLTNLQREWDRISDAFAIDRHSPLVQVQSTGDTHCHGKSTLMLVFANGQKILYKPRPLGIENAYQSFVRWINQHIADCKLKTINIVDCGNHGWVEFLPSTPCQTTGEIERFYWRQGANLALMHFLGGTDLHSENIIAMGEHPILIDLETLFHPHFGVGNLTKATEKSQNFLDTSVLRTLLLPHYLYSEDVSPFDVSGLSGDTVRTSPFQVLAWEDARTDNMHLVYQRMVVDPNDNLPVLNGVRIGPSGYVEDIVDGFAYVCKIIENQKNLLLGKNSPLNEFQGKACRIVFRPSNFYAQLVDESYHPVFTENEEKRRAFFCNALMEGTSRTRWLRQILPYEVIDLESGEIPYFTGTVGTLDVKSSEGETITDCSISNAWEECRLRVKQLNKENSEKQIWLIRAALASSKVQAQKSLECPPNLSFLGRCNGKSVPEAALSIAERLGAQLKSQNFESRAGTSWITAIPDRNETIVPQPTGYDFYNGLAGIAFTYSYLAKFTEREDFADLAKKAINESLQIYYRTSPSQLKVGAFDGAGGLIYALTHMHAVFNDGKYLDHANRIAIRSVEKSSCCKQVDLISGWSGFLLSVLSLYEIQASVQLMQLADFAAKKIETHLDYIERNENPREITLDPLSLAHGRGGLAWALFKLGVLENNQLRVARAEDLFMQEYAFFTDLEHQMHAQHAGQCCGDKEKHGSFLTWCRGAAGIVHAALACQMTSSVWTTPKVMNRIATQWQAAEKYGALSICHGAFGLSDLVQLAEKRKCLPTYISRKILNENLVRSATTLNQCDDPLIRLGIPGLMIGISGIICALLKIAEPENMPSVLTLDPSSH